jgi:hypothetical protein
MMMTGNEGAKRRLDFAIEIEDRAAALEVIEVKPPIDQVATGYRARMMNGL